MRRDALADELYADLLATKTGLSYELSEAKAL
jgi:hypothetical protein